MEETGRVWADYAREHKLCMRSAMQGAEDQVEHVMSLTLQPYPYPQALFQRGQELQGHFQDLYAQVTFSKHREWLEHIIEQIARTDDFNARLLGIWRSARACEHRASTTLGFFRSDYMLHQPTDRLESEDHSGSPSFKNLQLKQVEFNTISASLACISEKMVEMHKFDFLFMYALWMFAHLHLNRELHPELRDSIPANGSQKSLLKGLASAWAHYAAPSAIVLMMVQPNERNIHDQYPIVDGLLKEHGVICERMTMLEIESKGRIDQDGRLWVDGKEVAVVYWRTGYGPADYCLPGETVSLERLWKVRSDLEHCRAIKCPSVCLQLAGSKKVQQKLSHDLTRFAIEPQGRDMLQAANMEFIDLEQVRDIRQLLDGMSWNLDDWVLKPQREGGGNNIFGSDIAPFIKSLPDIQDLKNYVLMKMIRSPSHKTYILTGGDQPVVSLIDGVTEAVRLKPDTNSHIDHAAQGFYGYTLASDEEVLENEQGGYVLRTKSKTSNEGGLMVGRSSVDVPRLI